jgi:hypothetical protein
MSQSSKRLVLTVISILIIVIYFNTEFYKDWIDRRVVGPISDIGEQLSYMEPHERKEMRLGTSYIVSYNVAKYLKTNKVDSNAIVLLPPKEYVKAMKADYAVPEPVVFYYYTGIKAVWPDSKDVQKANYAVIYQNNNLQLLPVNDQVRAEVLKIFKPYKIHL